MIRGATTITSDRLVIEWRLPDGRIIRKGKRVGKDCPLTREEIRAFVEKDSVHAVKLIMERRGIRLAPAWNLLKEARGIS